MLFKKYGAKSNEIQLGLHYGDNPSKLNPFLTKKGDYYRIVNTLAERNAIPAEERSFGMRVVVIFDSTPANNDKYILANINLGGTNNNVLDNVNFIPDGGGGFVPSGTSLEYIKGDGTYGDFATSVAAISWSPDGNTFGVEKYIGTNDNFDLPIRTNGNEVARFTTTGNFGIGITAPTARLHIKGASSTSADYALKVDDLAGNRMLHVRNDGFTFFGPRYCYLSSSNAISGGEFNMVAEQLFLLDSTISRVNIEANNKPLQFNTWHGGAANNEVAFAGRGAAGFESFIRTYDVGTTEDGFKTYIGSSAAVGDTNFRHCFVTGNVHIGYDEVVNSNTTKLTIRSRNALAAQNNLLLQDNLSATLLKVRNDGSINTPLLPTSGSGFPPGGTVSGDLWVDTIDNTVKLVP